MCKPTTEQFEEVVREHCTYATSLLIHGEDVVGLGDIRKIFNAGYALGKQERGGDHEKDQL